jgi:hypothetical protein
MTLNVVAVRRAMLVDILTLLEDLRKALEVISASR